MDIIVFGLWHHSERRWLTLADLQVPCPRTMAIYASRADANYDIEERVSESDRPFIEARAIS